MPNSRDLVLVDPPSAIAVDATGAQLVDGYLATLQSDKSNSSVSESLRRITRAIDEGSNERAFPWHQLTFESMSVIKKRLAQVYPPTTANLSLSAMRQMLKIAFVRGFITREQRAAVDLIKNVRGSRLTKGRALEDQELAQLWLWLCGVAGPLGVMLRALFAALIGAGLRREEACNLRLAAYRKIDLHILGKGNKERRVPIDEKVQRCIEKWIETRAEIAPPHKLLFCTLGRKEHGPLSPWALWYTVESVTARAGLVDAQGVSTVDPHDFRRTFASRLLDRGFALEEVQKLMGHENIATTQRYDKRKEKQLADKRRSMVIFDFTEKPSA